MVWQSTGGSHRCECVAAGVLLLLHVCLAFLARQPVVLLGTSVVHGDGRPTMAPHCPKRLWAAARMAAQVPQEAASALPRGMMRMVPPTPVTWPPSPTTTLKAGSSGSRVVGCSLLMGTVAGVPLYSDWVCVV